MERSSFVALFNVVRIPANGYKKLQSFSVVINGGDVESSLVVKILRIQIRFWVSKTEDINHVDSVHCRRLVQKLVDFVINYAAEINQELNSSGVKGIAAAISTAVEASRKG